MTQVLLAAAGATGFGILFGMKTKKLWIIFLTSGLAWYIYQILCQWFSKDGMAMFLITVLIVFISGMLSLFIKCPVILFSTPILIPYIPGAALYYVMYDIVSGSVSITEDLKILLYQSGSMALGILVAGLILMVIQTVGNTNVHKKEKSGIINNIV